MDFLAACVGAIPEYRGAKLGSLGSTSSGPPYPPSAPR